MEGMTMIQRVYEQVSKVRKIADVYVATDDIRIFDLVHSFGGQALMTSPAHLSGTDRCAEAAKKLTISGGIILNVQGDEPFIAQEHIEKVIGCFDKKETGIASLVK
ncbi:MAG: cytidylyltransferase domain-containing protein, partial [Chitinophagaceae bacterium]